MRTDPFFLAPNLTLFLEWSPRMGRALRSRYWAVMCDQPDAPELLQQEYAE